jgi:hypothetical protein
MTDSGATPPLLRHVLATIAYRGAKAIRGAPPGFAGFRVWATSRTPLDILAHVGDLFDWARSAVQGQMRWAATPPRDWDSEVTRFFTTLAALDEAMRVTRVAYPAERLFQGPLADALTHVGQLTMLRRAAGSPVRGEDYYAAEIAAGQVTGEQPAPRFEFD